MTSLVIHTPADPVVLELEKESFKASIDAFFIGGSGILGTMVSSCLVVLDRFSEDSTELFNKSTALVGHAPEASTLLDQAYNIMQKGIMYSTLALSATTLLYGMYRGGVAIYNEIQLNRIKQQTQ